MYIIKPTINSYMRTLPQGSIPCLKLTGYRSFVMFVGSQILYRMGFFTHQIAGLQGFGSQGCTYFWLVCNGLFAPKCCHATIDKVVAYPPAIFWLPRILIVSCKDMTCLTIILAMDSEIVYISTRDTILQVAGPRRAKRKINGYNYFFNRLLY